MVNLLISYITTINICVFFYKKRKENNIPTYHPKIMRAQVRRYPLEAIDTEYNQLWDILETMDDMKIVGKMKSIVPEFLSNNSVYCQLDTVAPPQSTLNK